MSFVNRIKRNPHASKQTYILLLGEGFRCNVQDFGASRIKVGTHLFQLYSAQG